MNRNFSIEQVASAIEADAGHSLPDIRQALAEVKAGIGPDARIHTPAQITLRLARSRLGLSQQEFAARINTPPSTLRDWEQGRSTPPGAVLCLARLLIDRPELAADLASA